MKLCPVCRNAYPNDYQTCPRDQTVLTGLSNEITTGTVLRGKYEVLGELGTGGMATVYKVRHTAFQELAAVKVVHQHFMNDLGFVKRFRNEAVVARQLKHPNAVRIDDFDYTEDGRPFIVMEYVNGRSLYEMRRGFEGPWPPERCINIVTQAALALGAAHTLGIVHRDIKPQNILLMRGDDGTVQVKVLDFGIAKVSENRFAGMTSVNTQQSLIIGTPDYMSPEQASGRKESAVDGRADIYSLGLVFYEMLTGRHPFQADTPMGMLFQQVHSAPPPPESITVPPVSSAVSALVLKALHKDPKERYQSAAELLEAMHDPEAWYRSQNYPAVVLAEAVEPVLDIPNLLVLDGPVETVMDEAVTPVLNEPFVPAPAEPLEPVLTEPVAQVDSELAAPVLGDLVEPAPTEPSTPVLPDLTEPVQPEAVTPPLTDAVKPIPIETFEPLPAEPIGRVQVESPGPVLAEAVALVQVEPLIVVAAASTPATAMDLRAKVKSAGMSGFEDKQKPAWSVPVWAWAVSIALLLLAMFAALGHLAPKQTAHLPDEPTETASTPKSAPTLAQGSSLPSDTDSRVNRYRQATAFYNQRNYRKSVELYSQTCNEGFTPGCVALGSLYWYGIGVQKDVAKAMDLFQKSCQKGDQVGCRDLKEGQNLKQNDAQQQLSSTAILPSNQGQQLNGPRLPVAAPQEPELITRPTWTDTATGLTWERTDNGSDVTWQEAGKYCRGLRLEGHDDWRLPTIDELQGIYDSAVNIQGQCCGGESVTWHVKGNLKLSGIDWSSTRGNAPGEAWAFFFIGGGRHTDAPGGDISDGRALCVRHSGD